MTASALPLSPPAPDARPVPHRPACSPHGVVDAPGAGGTFSIAAIDHEQRVAHVRFYGVTHLVPLDRDDGRWYFPTHLASYGLLPSVLLDALETDAAQERLDEIDADDRADARRFHDWMV